MTHAVVSITEKPASGPGALDGYEAICSCGFSVGTSLSAREAGYQMRFHIGFMTTRSATKSRRKTALSINDARA